MTFAVRRSSSTRHLVLRASPGDKLPESLTVALAAESVKHGWLRATGVLEGAEIRAVGAEAASTRRVEGPVHLLVMEAPLGEVGRDARLVCRGLVAFDGEHGYETLAVEIVSARVRTMDVFVTVLDDLRAADTWSAAFEATGPRDSSMPGAPATASKAPGGAAATAMPQRPLRPPSLDIDGPVPEVGDTVDHFAFGPGDVLKSDGDRLHVRAAKDGRIREIALEMLRVSSLEGPPGSSGTRHFKLERRL